jgi:hypothetical protein
MERNRVVAVVTGANGSVSLTDDPNGGNLIRQRSWLCNLPDSTALPVATERSTNLRNDSGALLHPPIFAACLSIYRVPQSLV